MRFSDLKTFVTAGYVAYGYDPAKKSFPVIDPGPSTTVELLKLSPDRIVFLSFGGGAGLSVEGLFDRPFINARVIGRQDDYDDAEKMMYELDTMLLAVGSNATIGTARVLYITRSGGGPTLLEKDEADRYHFSCSYIIETVADQAPMVS